MSEYKTYVKAARIKTDCPLDIVQMMLKEIGKSLQYGSDFVKLIGHHNWEAKSSTEGEDIIISISCRAKEYKDKLSKFVKGAIK